MGCRIKGQATFTVKHNFLFLVSFYYKMKCGHAIDRFREMPSYDGTKVILKEKPYSVSGQHETDA